jgi:glycosyltransferase involved in cell wall biosynthesis
MVVKRHGSAGPSEALRELLAFSAKAGITIIDDVFDQAKIRLLQAAADAFISLHRSEGFGLNISECMSLEKPVVVTAFSGNMDFTNDANSYLIPWKMRQVAPDEYPHGTGQWWAEPDHDAAVAALQTVTEQSAHAAERGARARTEILAHCSLAAVSRRISRLLACGKAGTS